MAFRRTVGISALLLVLLFLTYTPTASSERALSGHLTGVEARSLIPEPAAPVWPSIPPSPESRCLDSACTVTIHQLTRPYDWYRWQGDPTAATGYPACMYSNKLCGAACASMAIAYARYGQQVSLRELHETIKPGSDCSDYWTWPDIARALQIRQWEVPFSLLDLSPGMPELVAALDRGHPCIVAIRSGAIPPAEGDSWVGRYYAHTSGHIVLVMGYTWDHSANALAHVVVYDPLVFRDPPYWDGSYPKGMARLYEADAFWRAVRSNATLMFEIEYHPMPRITGDVVDDATGRGLALAVVHITDSSGAIHTIVTDVEGRYALDYVPDGAITIAARYGRVGASTTAEVITGRAVVVPSIRLVLPRMQEQGAVLRNVRRFVRDAW